MDTFNPLLAIAAFEKVSEKRYEVDPAVVEKVRDLRGCEKAREAKECMNGELGREEIEEAMKEMRVSAWRGWYKNVLFERDVRGGERCSDWDGEVHV